MDGVTYPDQKVAETISENMIPVRVPFDAEPLSSEYNVMWTPTLIVVDEAKTAHHRSTGFLPSEQMIPAILLGRGKMHLGRNKLDDAIGVLSDLIDDHPGSFAAPQAVYYRGVSRYKKENKPDPLKTAHEELQEGWANSEWAVKSMPYRLL
jgi:hypothetical protein